LLKIPIVSFEMVSLAKNEGGGLNWLYKTFSIESNGLESLDVNAVDKYTFSQLKYKTTD